ncbi:MAG: gliding motility-associated C-terminal domain-containing protein [Bacteroidia bacterium]|nr:gliding motility-associated C-terminal domain-containing protein [Bacteroidia bacterium]
MNRTSAIFIILSAWMLSLGIRASAQDILPNKVYRVTAYKQGDNQITSTSNYAEVIPPLRIYIPNAFTPNGDGMNDTFGVKGEGIRDYHLYIYDRWGAVLFDSVNPQAQWDGKYKGQPVQAGTYVYQVFALGFPGHEKTGSVTLIR